VLLVAHLLAPVAGAGAPADSLRAPLEAESEAGFPWGYLGAALGLTAGLTAAVAFKKEADHSYDLYLDTADPDAARAYFAEAERYDRATLLGWVVAEVSVVALFFFLTREEERPLVPTVGEPLIRPLEDGIEIGLRIQP
jgi:hypothetical protein